MSEETILSNSAAHRADSFTATGSIDERKVDLLSHLLTLLRYKKTILRYAGIALLLSAIAVFFIIKPTYTAEAVFIPPQSSPGSGLSQLAGQLGSLGVAGGLMGLKTPGDIYLGILQSRTVSDDIIARFHLQEVYKSKELSGAEKMLQANAKFVAGKNTLIRITVEDHDANRAAAIANGFLDELQNQNGRLAITEASQRRLFFEQQLEKEKNALADAEVDLRKTQESTGLIVPTGQMQLEIGTIANIRAQITSREIQLASLRQGATNQNPDVVRLQTEIEQLQQQLRRLQDSNQKTAPGNTEVPTAKVPALALEFIRKQREVKYHEMLFESLAKQYEMARLDESREAPVLQVVDRAIVPDTKSGPHRLLLMIGSTFGGALLGAIVVFFRSYLKAMKNNPATADRLRSLSEEFSLRR